MIDPDTLPAEDTPVVRTYPLALSGKPGYREHGRPWRDDLLELTEIAVVMPERGSHPTDGQTS